jgi:hypothetical protein
MQTGVKEDTRSNDKVGCYRHLGLTKDSHKRDFGEKDVKREKKKFKNVHKLNSNQSLMTG